MNATMIGLDLAKNVFQVHGTDAAGGVVVRRQLRRGQMKKFFAALPPAVVGMEACGGAHHWARVLQGLGHEVRLMPPAYVKPYVKRNKTDGRDAEAICEAMQRPTMRFVAVKSPAQQAVQMLHRSRALLVRQRTMAANALRAGFAEFGLVARQGSAGLRSLLTELETLPEAARHALEMLGRHWEELGRDIAVLERRIVAAARADERARRLMAIPGLGPIGASALVAAVPDARVFRSGRGFAAWLGLTARQNNTAGRRRAGGISKQGERYLRSLLIIGASSHLRQERRRGVADPWLAGLLARRPVKVAMVAQAAKTARIVWAVLAKEEPYRAPLRKAA